MRLGRRGIAVGLTAAVLGATAVVLALVRALSDGVDISIHGYLAMGAAVIGTILLAGGLMWLAFYSARAGWDEIDRDP